MAINETCSCGANFITSPSSGKYQCDECDGTNARKKAEVEHWESLTPDQKCEELLVRIKSLEQQLRWRDMRF
jgi:hypothetical protein